MLTFSNLQTHVMTFLDLAGDTGQGLDVVKFAIQAAQEKRLTTQRWSFMLWPTPVEMTLTSGKRNFILNEQALMLSDFQNISSGSRLIETPTRSRYKSGVQDDRLHFEFVNHTPVKRQPSEPGLITVSGSTKIRFMNSADDIVEETITDAPSSGTVNEILNVTKLNNNTLVITDADTNTLLSLSADQYGKSYPQIRTFADQSGEDAEYRFYRKPSLLVHDNDVPDIPYPFSRILVFDALLELATYNDAPAPNFWLAEREAWDMQMRQTYIEGEMEGAESRTVHEVDTFGG